MAQNNAGNDGNGTASKYWVVANFASKQSLDALRAMQIDQGNKVNALDKAVGIADEQYKAIDARLASVSGGQRWIIGLLVSAIVTVAGWIIANAASL